MSEQQFTQQDIATTVAETLNMFSTQAVDHALVLLPHPETPGNPAVVITARDGSRYGLEVCPIPEPHMFPSGTLQSMTTVPTEPEQPQDPSTVTAPTEEPPVHQEPPYVGPDSELSQTYARLNAREVWPEAEGFERVPGGWTFRVGAGYASVADSGHVTRDPQGTRSDAKRFMQPQPFEPGPELPQSVRGVDGSETGA